ncbi:MAG: hypothetical protein WCA08_03395 [Desulfoferrobacter sp.]
MNFELAADKRRVIEKERRAEGKKSRRKEEQKERRAEGKKSRRKEG